MLTALRQFARIDATKRARDHAVWLGPTLREASGSDNLCLGLFSAGRSIHEAQLRLVDALAEGLPAGRWLDVGSGLGGPAHRWLEDEDRQVTAVELVPGRVARTPPHPRLRSIVGDADRMPFFEEFDVVLALESGHYARDLSQFLHQCWLALSPGGWLSAAVVLRKREHLRLYDVGVIRAAEQALGCSPLATSEDWESILARTGFVDVRLQDRSKEVIAGLPLWADALATAGGSRGSLGARCLRYVARRGSSGPLRYGLVRARKPQ
ncbi:MAG TPA: methyltransferase domain-containing protein [Myxococcota bacterium]|nr:methyltransferase domain-containing protein [Myxococcota bacterium]